MNKCIIVGMLITVVMGSSQPVWTVLEQMTIEERQNADIDIMLGKDATENALVKARHIEGFWNSGRFDDALSLFPELGELTNTDEMTIGCTWRRPIITAEQADWADDVLVSSRDSTYLVQFDIHYPTGNLFVVQLYTTGTFWRWAVNISTNGGLTWSETYNYWALYQLNWVSAAVLHDHCYVVYPGDTDNSEASITRFRASDGQQEDFNNGSTFIEICDVLPTHLTEVTMNSIVIGGYNRLYFFGISVDEVLHYYWSDSSATTWTEYQSGISWADRGLAACPDVSSTYFFFVSFITFSGSASIYGLNFNGSWDSLWSSNAGENANVTSISAFHDTVACAYEYSDGNRIRTAWSYGDWVFAMDEINDYPVSNPCVTLTGGGGAAIAYKRFNMPTSYAKFMWCEYHENWSGVTPVIFTDHPYQNSTNPSIKFIGFGIYGLVYCGIDASSHDYAYFDRSDWTGVRENRADNVEPQVVSLVPNPSRGSVNLSYAVKKSGNITISMFDAAGRLVKNLVNETKPAGMYTISVDNTELSAGVYFVRVETADGLVERKMMIIR